MVSTPLLAMVRFPERVPLLQFTVCFPPVPPKVRLATLRPEAAVTVKVPLLVMNTVSLEPGTWLGFQLAAVFQSPPAVLVQVIAAAAAGVGLMASAVPHRQTHRRRVCERLECFMVVGSR